jgi:hypothetical protein
MDFEREWTRLKRCGTHGSFAFKGTSADWRQAVSQHFRSMRYARPIYGVYVVRQRATTNVIYIGKGGTMQQGGRLKAQELDKRLVNREKGRSRKDVFGERVVTYGELLIEYVILNPQKLVPGYVEARLLQAFFNVNGCLPSGNDVL